MGLRKEIFLLKEGARAAVSEFKVKQSKKPKGVFKKDFLQARSKVIKKLGKPMPFNMK